jgi:DNA modification methylase
MLMNSSQEGDTCLDLFAGSGFSLIACHKLKRIWRGMELEPKYVDVIVKRWENYTGLTAKRVSHE